MLIPFTSPLALYLISESLLILQSVVYLRLATHFHELSDKKVVRVIEMLNPVRTYVDSLIIIYNQWLVVPRK